MSLRAATAAMTAAVVAGTALVFAAPAHAAAAFDGSSPERAAASCWEVRQTDPGATSGRYWLLTPQLQAPARFYCDQITDGGGWVLVGRGRNSWVESGDGRGTTAAVASPSSGPAAFSAKQLSNQTIDALLGGKRVDALTDGIRLRRSTNQAGTTSQEVRFRLRSRDRWTWAFPAGPSAGLAVSSYSVDGITSTKAQTTRDMTLTTDTQRVFTFSTSLNNYVRGFSYGKNGPTGSTSASSHLYSTVGGHFASPFTQMYLRPRLTTASVSYRAVPDSGTAAQAAPAIPESEALPSPWGVTGLGKGGSLYYATEVSAFAQIGRRIFVGGNFTRVRNRDGSKVYKQPYLAAFDATTGAWISSFRPRFNNQVKALAALPNGRLAVGGQFTTLAGRTATNLVVLNPRTGAKYAKFTAKLGQTTPGAKKWVRTLDVSGSYLYVGGGFTSYSGGTRTSTASFRNIVRVNAATGTADLGWRPNLGSGAILSTGKRSSASSVLSLDVSGGTVYAAGQFQQAYVGRGDNRATVAKVGAAAISTKAPARFTRWSPTYSTTTKRNQYQQAVARVGSRVWLGGSQHNLFSYVRSTLKLASTNITLSGGDIQAITSGRGIVYASCHCEFWNYSGTARFDPPQAAGFTQVDRINYVGAWNASSGAYYPAFAPTSKTRHGEGPWALLSATDGTLWSGGDYVSVTGRGGTKQWTGGFARFALRPHTPPAAPRGLTVTLSGSSAHVSWTASSTREVAYEVIRNNRVVGIAAAGATSAVISGSSPGDRWFVRASDGRGNRSASTRVAKAP